MGMGHGSSFFSRVHVFRIIECASLGVVMEGSMADQTLVCWTVTCPKDETVLFLDVIGPPEPYRIPMVPPCRPFTVKCPVCSEEHKFSERDLEDKPLLNPHVLEPSRSFRAALIRDPLPPI
jgi:hypothetical protein